MATSTHGHGREVVLSHSLSPHRCWGPRPGREKKNSPVPPIDQRVGEEHAVAHRGPLGQAVEQQAQHGAGHQALHQLAMRLAGVEGLGRGDRDRQQHGAARVCTRSSSSCCVPGSSMSEAACTAPGMGCCEKRQRAAHQQRRGAGSGRSVDLDGRSTRNPPRAPIGAARRRRCADQQDPDRLGAQAEVGIKGRGRRGEVGAARQRLAHLITPDGSASAQLGRGLDAARAGVDAIAPASAGTANNSTTPARHRRARRRR